MRKVLIAAALISAVFSVTAQPPVPGGTEIDEPETENRQINKTTGAGESENITEGRASKGAPTPTNNEGDAGESSDQNSEDEGILGSLMQAISLILG